MKLTHVKTLALSLLLGLASNSLFAVEKMAPTNAPKSTPTVQMETVATPISNASTVNINSASAAEIQDKLVGIGAKKAQAIVDYRTQNGAFASVDQLTEVSGIGKATLDKNRERIVLQ